MKPARRFLSLSAACVMAVVASAGCSGDDAARPATSAPEHPAVAPPTETHAMDDHKFPVTKSDAEWRADLTDMQYYVTRAKGTERAFTGEYWDHKGDGVYVCVACGQPLYDSSTKYDSGCGWPSYYDAIDGKAIVEQQDTSWFMVRTELMCSRCGAHLGHVFNDGPPPTGLRHCINSASLKFVPREQAGKVVPPTEKSSE